MPERASARHEALRAHPEFPWLSAGDATGIETFLQARGWLEEGERVLRCGRAGEGNMNLTLRIDTGKRRFVLKQARPWVEKYEDIEAPWERSLFEARFYARIARLPEVCQRMPALLASDAAARVILLEDLRDAEDLFGLYAEGGAPLEVEEIESLADFAHALHGATRGSDLDEFSNREMRALNHAHIFEVPFDPANGLDLEALEPGLDAAAAALRDDTSYRRVVRETGERYLAEPTASACLVHGDYFPGSWLRGAGGLRVIDPEFAFAGDAEVDVGCALAHFALAGLDLEQARRLVGRYESRGGPRLDASRLARFAAVEVMRRLIGVAQLPLPGDPALRDRGPRATLLERSRDAILSGTVERLWR